MKLIRKIISRILITYKPKLIPVEEDSCANITLVENIQKTVYLNANKND
jgi:hypothetical protein